MVNINLIYGAHKGNPSVNYRGPEGTVQTWFRRHRSMTNVGLSFYALRNPQIGDCLWVLEPRCVHAVDYNPAFLQKFHRIFSWAANALKQHRNVRGRVIEVNHPSCRDAPRPEIIEKRMTVPWESRKKEIVIIANNKLSMSCHAESELYSLRLALADALFKAPGFDVSWYGHMKLKKPYYKGTTRRKHDVLGKAQFSLCTENSYHPVFSHNYFTEKMPQTWFSGAVPIYMGCHNVDDFKFGPNTYVDLRKFVTKNGPKKYDVKLGALLNELKAFDTARYDKMKEEMHDLLTREDGLYHILSYERVYKRMFQELA